MISTICFLTHTDGVAASGVRLPLTESSQPQISAYYLLITSILVLREGVEEKEGRHTPQGLRIEMHYDRPHLLY